MVQDAAKRISMLVLVIILFVLAFFVIKDLLIPIMFGLLFAYIFHPVFNVIYKRVKYRTLSALILIILIVIVIAVPLILVTPLIIRQTVDTYISIQNVDIVASLEKVLPSLIPAEYSKTISASLSNLVGKIFTTFLNEFQSFLVNVFDWILKGAVFLFVFFFAVKDSEKLKEYFTKLSPLSESTENKFMNEFRGITNALIYGQVLIAIIQGLVLGVGLFILGVPKAITLSAVTMIVAMIPVLGAWLIWLPVSVVLITTGHASEGVILILYGALFVSLIDNLLRPIFLSKKSVLSIPISFVGIIGGLYFLGLAGIILGPLILAYALIIIDFYKQGKLNEIFKS
ncbi:MAG: AI-2E family transporter [archaeon]